MLAHRVTTKSQKSTYKPRVQKIADGAYTVPSERWGGHILYLVTVRPDGGTTCECEAGRRAKSCKHQRLVAGLVAYNAKPQHIRPVQTWTGAQGLMEAFA
jgi:hypothetical protein